MLVAALLMAAPTSHAQQPQTLPGFAEVLDVRVVNLEVVVTDRTGARVPGLQADDFELLIDGKVTAIEFFSEILGGVPQATKGGVRSVSDVETGKTVPTNYLLFIDDFFANAQDRDRVLNAMAEQIRSLGATDRAAIVAFDGTDLTLLTSWTSEQSVLANALVQAKRRPTFGLQRLAERRNNDSDRVNFSDVQLLTIERTRGLGNVTLNQPFARVGLAPEERNYAFQLAGQLERSVVAATSALRSFAGAPGRKVMLLLIGGWPFAPAEYTVGSFSPLVEEATSGSLQTFFSIDLYSPLVDSANLTGFTLYPVDVPGQAARLGLDASDNAGEFQLLTPGANLRSTGTPREQQIHATLDHLAHRTGGRALRNAQRDHAFQLAAEDTRSYYWMGFSPSRAADDSKHTIKVRVRGRKDLTVRARDGFVDQSTNAEVTMIVESALLFGNPPSTKPLRLRFGKPKRSLRKFRISLEVGINMDDVTLIPNQGRYQNRLEIRISALSNSGERSGTTLDTIFIDGANPPKPGQMFYYETTLTLRKKPHRIVVAVHDPLSGDLLSSTGEIGLR